MDEQKIIELYEEYGNGGLVAKKLNINNYQVYKALRKNGIEPKKVGGKEKHSVSTMIDMYNNGLSTIQIADQLNMNPSSVFERLKNSNIQIRSRQEALELCGHTKATVDREQEIIDLYLGGMSSSQIAVKIGLKAKDGILRVLKKHNIKARNMYGANNPAWKGGRVPLNKLIRNHSRYTDFVKYIMSSRDFTCEMTGERGGRLNVHHNIVSFSKLVDNFISEHSIEILSDREKLNAAIENYMPFWDESNVLLVTETAHKRIHQEIGKDSD